MIFEKINKNNRTIFQLCLILYFGPFNHKRIIHNHCLESRITGSFCLNGLLVWNEWSFIHHINAKVKTRNKYTCMNAINWTRLFIFLCIGHIMMHEFIQTYILWLEWKMMYPYFISSLQEIKRYNTYYKNML